MNALIVEDNIANQKVMMRQLQRLSITAEVADSVASARVLWQTHRFDIVLADLRLPGEDGVDLARWLRQQPGGAAIPVVLVTADRVTSRSDAKEPGLFDAFMTKPVSMAQLREVITMLAGDCLPGSAASTEETAREIEFPHVDTDVLARYVGNEPDMYGRFLVQFIEVMDQDVAFLQSQPAVPCDELEFVAHKLKSTCRTVGANNLTDRFEKLEAQCRQGEPLGDTVQQLLTHWQDVRRDLVAALTRAGMSAPA